MSGAGVDNTRNLNGLESLETPEGLVSLGEHAQELMNSLLDHADLKEGSLVVVGCSTSEVHGQRIGKGSSVDIGRVLFDSFDSVLSKRGIFLAAQCCEHLNRALVVERAALAGMWDPTLVAAVPYPHAGGAFASAVYRGFKEPVLVEKIQAHAGLDIGQTLIGMHLRPVAVPLRLKDARLGEATVVAAYTRPKYTGGPRAHYSLDDTRD
ncbi:MAG: TIGR01440 family protein [Actinomycetaceae bacterium]|nr:TIGR01440 family protein [Actinomycetaceae bacterium]